jgi:wobble nucleotide-excising tRNase
LAFFFASLDQDSALASKVVVIDDPVSSLDEHRTFTTFQEIRRLAERAGQVVVLSHSKPFLGRIWDGAEPSARSAIKVVRDGASSTLRAWDVAADAMTEHDRRHASLTGYLDTGSGDPREVARAIRPYLEAYCRVVWPEHFRADSLLGQFIGLCEQRVGSPRQILDSSLVGELRDLNEYASRYHHQGWETEPISDGELRGFIGRALTFVRR